MAIVVEEEKKRSNILGLAGWFVFLAVFIAAIYYIFFVTPAVVSIPTTGTLATIAPIVSANLSPQSIVGSSQFESLQSNITLPTPASPNSVGRSNPFIVP
jgi:hypothetical protein